jgi:hypothetical protein
MTRLRRIPFLVVVALLLVVVVRLQLADTPLERDEGEYAYAGQLILDGVPPYQLAYNMKFPGTYYAYAAIEAVFGESAEGVRRGLLCVNVMTAILVFFLGRRWLSEFAAAASSVAFAALSLDPWTMGPYAHATHFVALFSTAAWLVMWRARDKPTPGHFLGSGVLLGAAALLSQQGVFLAAGGLGVMWWTERTAIRVALGAIGIALPLAAAGCVLALQGVFDRFWFWTFQYARAYVSEQSLAAAWPLFSDAVRRIAQADAPIWCLAALGLILLWTSKWTTEVRVFLTVWLVAAFAAICPGFYFRPHYFILLLPPTALLAGVALGSLKRRLVGEVAFAAVIGLYLLSERELLFTMTGPDLNRTIHQGNPFNESPEIAKYIADRTTPVDRIAVLGSEPQIYFYAHRQSATGYIYTYALLEQQPFVSRMQDEMMQEITSAHPAYLVFAGGASSWASPKLTDDRRILAWVQDYSSRCYELVGVVDILWPLPSKILWDDEVRGYVPASDQPVFTYRRSSSAPCAVPIPRRN